MPQDTPRSPGRPPGMGREHRLRVAGPCRAPARQARLSPVRWAGCEHPAVLTASSCAYSILRHAGSAHALALPPLLLGQPGKSEIPWRGSCGPAFLIFSPALHRSCSRAPHTMSCPAAPRASMGTARGLPGSAPRCPTALRASAPGVSLPQPSPPSLPAPSRELGRHYGRERPWRSPSPTFCRTAPCPLPHVPR